jgi:hypothetical protein
MEKAHHPRYLAMPERQSPLHRRVSEADALLPVHPGGRLFA